MAEQHYPFLQSLVQKFAVTRVGAWFFARCAHRLDRIYLKLSGGKGTLVTIVSGLPALVMTTTGVKSGLPRTVNLVCIREAENSNRLAVVASNFGQHALPGWYYNLKANPRLVCTFDGVTRPYIAHEAEGEEYDRFWQLATQTFFGYLNYRQHAGRRIPIMVLAPQEHDSTISLKLSDER